MMPTIRECGGCTRCCEGWLYSTIQSYPMYPGRKCHFMKPGGCGIYDTRPEDPCKKYVCAWRTEAAIPEWMKPSEANVIFTWKYSEEIKEPYLDVVECGEKLSVEVLSWIIHFHLRHNANISYRIDRGHNYIGTIKFMKWMEKYAAQKLFPFWKDESEVPPQLEPPDNPVEPETGDTL